MNALLRSFGRFLLGSALVWGLVSQGNVFGQPNSGWRPSRNPLPMADAPPADSDSFGGPSAETAQRNRWTSGSPTNRYGNSMYPQYPQPRGTPIVASPMINSSGARTLPFAEDEIVLSPQPDTISNTQVVDGPINPQMPYPQMQYSQGYPQMGYPQGDGQFVDGQYYGGQYYGGPQDGSGCGPGCGPGGCPPYGLECFWPFHHLANWWHGGNPNYGCPDDCCTGADVMASERFHPCSCLSFLNETSIATGTTAFKGPVDLGANGNFGFYEALNVGDVLFHRRGIGYQVGVNFVQSDLNGSVFSTSSRQQTFFTVGMFHRAFYGRGWQGGIVFDYLNDNYYLNYNVAQLRYEYSIVGANGHELGYWGTASSRSATTITQAGAGLGFPTGTNINTRPISLNQIFYRKTNSGGGQGRVWVGFASGVFGNSATTTTTDAIVGGDFRVPLSNQFDFYGGYNYVIPSQGPALNTTAEGWGLAFGVAFYPARCRNGVHNTPYRPLFNVADNSTLMLDNRIQPPTRR